jgi:predicted Zn-dependent protease
MNSARIHSLQTKDEANSMGFTGENSESGAKSARPFRVDLLQEDFDREFFGRILSHSDNNTDVVKRQAELLARHGDYADALHWDRLLAERHPSDPVVHYNLACSLSMSGEFQTAVCALARAIELGYHDYAHILADPDLDPIRDLPIFGELLRRQCFDEEPPFIA